MRLADSDLKAGAYDICLGLPFDLDGIDAAHHIRERVALYIFHSRIWYPVICNSARGSRGAGGVCQLSVGISLASHPLFFFLVFVVFVVR